MAKVKFGNLLNVGLENDDEQLPGDDTVVADAEPEEAEVDEVAQVADETLAADETVEAGETAIVEAEDGVAEATQTMDELDEAADELDEAEATLESFLEDGGMSHQAAIAYGLTTSRLRKRLGAGAFSNTPSVEDFGGTGTRYDATVASLEDIRETKDRVLKAIAHYIEVAKKALKDFWVRLWDTSPKLKARLEAIASAAEKGSGEPKSKTVKVSSLNNLRIAGVVPADFPGDTKKSVDELISAMKGMGDRSVDVAKQMVAWFKSDMLQHDNKYISSVVEKIRSKSDKADSLQGVPSGYVARALTDEVLGGKKVFEAVPADPKSEWESAVSLRTGLATVKKEGASGNEAPTLSLKEIVSVCGDAARGCDAVGNYRRDYEKREQAFEALAAAAKDLASRGKEHLKEGSVDEDKKDDVDNMAKNLPRYVGKFASGVMGAPEQSARHMLVIGKAIAQYSAASLKAHGKQEESKEEGGAAAA